MTTWSLLDLDHFVVETPDVERVRHFFLAKMKFGACPSAEDEVLRGKCRIKIRPPRAAGSDWRSANDRRATSANSSSPRITSPDSAAVVASTPRNSTAGSTPVDSVTDVAFLVSGLEALVRRVESLDADLLLEDVTRVETHPRLGPHRRAVVKSIVGNVMHSLIEIDNSAPTPRASLYSAASTSHSQTSKSASVTATTAEIAATPENCLQDEISSVDHVAIACRVGESAEIVRWYEQVFGMKAFDFGEDGEGIEIRVDDIGMQLKALEYWRCSEKGLYTPGISSPYKKSHPFGRKMDKFPLFVVAEPLPGADTNNQIDVFVSEHGGAGIQHVGLCTSDICRSKREMLESGVSFVEPPPTYYDQSGKLDDIVKAGESPSELQRHGILIDYEDYNERDTPGLTSGYLMQVFTKPVFAQRTFFMELIERRGARGFGAGNITALFRAVQAYMRQGL